MKVLQSVSGALLMSVWIVQAQPVSAETLWHSYYTFLSRNDAFNSTGVPLDDICDIAQQDRANWQRFYLRDQGDEVDAFFTTPERRALFTRICDAPRPYFANAGDRIRSGTRMFYVYIRILGANGRATRILISEGPG